MKTYSTTFRAALATAQVARRQLKALQTGKRPPLSALEFKAAVSLVFEAQNLVNEFVGAFGDEENELLKLDRATVEAELEMACDAALDIYGEVEK